MTEIKKRNGSMGFLNTPSSSKYINDDLFQVQQEFNAKNREHEKKEALYQ